MPLAWEAFDDFTAFAAEREFIPMRELIYQYLRNSIISGKIPAGTHLVEEELAKQLAASRTPVREALRKLESADLVKHYRRRGVEVRQITPKDAADLYDMCALLEGHAARLMAEHGSPEALYRLYHLLEQMRQCLAEGDEAAEMGYHRDFHRTIYSASGNKRLEHLLYDYTEYVQLFRSYYIHSCWMQDLKEHEDLYDAIANRDGGRAEEVARNHILQSKDAFILAWEKKHGR